LDQHHGWVGVPRHPRGEMEEQQTLAKEQGRGAARGPELPPLAPFFFPSAGCPAGEVLGDQGHSSTARLGHQQLLQHDASTPYTLVWILRSVEMSELCMIYGSQSRQSNFQRCPYYLGRLVMRALDCEFIRMIATW
jgi:hypothetical protein